MSDSADKRSITTDALETLGTIISPKEKRDAIHLAVEPIEASEELAPGDHVGIVNGKATAKAPKHLGIVDPFLDKIVEPGDRFWLVVYPRQITSLRHVWTHPDFKDISEELGDKDFSEQWLKDFCAKSDCPSYETLIEGIKKELNLLSNFIGDVGDEDHCGIFLDSEYLHCSGMDAHGSIPPEFWEHIEIVLGVKVPNYKKAEYFSCSC